MGSEPCPLNESLHKRIIDFFLYKNATGSETDLSLVGKGGLDHGGEALIQVCVTKHNACILTAKLWKGGREGRRERGKIVVK